MNQQPICTREEYDALCDWSIAEAASDLIAELTGKTKQQAMEALQYAASLKVSGIRDRTRAAKLIIEFKQKEYEHYVTNVSSQWEESA